MIDVRLPSDHDQREAALDVNRSFIVQAPAGSGKTGLLTQRFLALLAVARQPEDILAITFTRKARGEMLERVLAALEMAADPPMEPLTDNFQQQLLRLAKRALARSEELGWCLLQQPSRLRILTIDAFNASLTRQLPILSQYGAQPQVVDNAERLYRQAVRQVLVGEHLSIDQQQQVHAVLTHTGFQHETLEATLVAMLNKREQWLDLLAVDANDRSDRKRLEQVLALIVEEHLQMLQPAGGGIWAELVELGEYAARQSRLLDKRWLSDTAIERLAGIQQTPTTSSRNLPQWKALTELVLTSGGKPGLRTSRGVQKQLGFPEKNSQKARMQVLLEQLCDQPALVEQLIALRYLPDPHYPDKQWRILQPMLDTLQLCLAELLLVFREQGMVDHNEMAARALQALSVDDQHSDTDSPSDLALQLDARIAHILVDEFQDTSIGQLQLLQKLTRGWQSQDGNSLFLVGDPMQSIYRFRKAEVGIFLSVWQQGLGDLSLEQLQLSVNFRTQQALLEWCNSAFQSVLPASDDLDAGAVRWAPSEAWHSVSTAQAVGVYLQPEKNQTAEAGQLLELVRQALQRDTRQIAILVRRRRDATDILAALRAANIAYQAVDMASLEQTAEIRDLLALTQALVHPGDRLSWLSVLRAPWCGLELAELLPLAELGHAQGLTLVDLDEFDPVTRQRLARVLSVLQAAVANRQKLSLRQLITHTWQQLGGPACYASNAALDNAERFLEQLDNESVAGDLDDPLQLEQQLTRIYATPDTRPEAARVQVMTIHKAKGLEFDEVILPGLGNPIRHSNNDQPLLISESRPVANTNGLLLGMRQSVDSSVPDPVYQFINRLHRQRQENEARRLLYVAATRARQRLHLLGHLDPKVEQPPKNSPMEWLWLLVEDSAQTAALSELGGLPSPASQALSRLPADWQPLPAHEDKIVPDTQAVMSIAELSLENLLPDSPVAAAIGRVVHRGLEALVKYGEDWWQQLDQSEWAELQLQREGLMTELQVTARQQILMAMNNTLQDETGRWLLQSHTESVCEFAISYFQQGRLASAIIDRTFVDENDVRWIIDYKTGLHQGGDVQVYIHQQVQRYRPQMDKYRRLMSVIDRRDMKVGLYFPLLQQFVLIEA